MLPEQTRLADSYCKKTKRGGVCLVLMLVLANVNKISKIVGIEDIEVVGKS